MAKTITNPENLIKGKRYEFTQKIGNMTSVMTGVFDSFWIFGGETKITFDCDSGAWKGVRGFLRLKDTIIKEIK